MLYYMQAMAMWLISGKGAMGGIHPHSIEEQRTLYLVLERFCQPCCFSSSCPGLLNGHHRTRLLTSLVNPA